MIITAGKYKGLKVEAPDEKITRPTLSKIRMAVFNTLSAMMDFEGHNFLDMYAGSGIMGLEAFSRGFDNVTELELDGKVFSVLKRNCSKFSNENIRLYKGDSLKYVEKLKNQFDVVYVDPPYFIENIYEKSLEAVKSCARGIIIVEHVIDVNFDGFKLVKQKSYGKKRVSFLLNLRVPT